LLQAHNMAWCVMYGSAAVEISVGTRVAC
jgi:hypothetical protein